jgi:hypothetical protein
MSRKNYKKFSAISLDSLPRKPQYVVIKGFMNEPIMLKFFRYSRKFIEVLCCDGKTRTNYAYNDAFCYDKIGFEKLWEAYESGNKKRLEQEWAKAKPIIPT